MPTTTTSGVRHSRVCAHRLTELLAARQLDAAALAKRAKIPHERVSSLLDDRRAVLTPAEIEAICMSTQATVPELFCYDPPAVSLRELVAHAMPERELGERVELAICGAGNLGHVFAGLLGARDDVRVRLWTIRPGRAAQILAGVERGGIRVRRRDAEIVGRPDLITQDPHEAIAGADIVLSCLPAHVEPEALARLVPALEPGALLGSIPGPGGFCWAARAALDAAGKSARVFGLASIPWMCKLREPGALVDVLGAKTITGVASLAPADADATADVLSALLELPVVDIENFLQIILNPGNQILHPGIMYERYRGWDGSPEPEPPLFYESLSRAGAELVERLGDELIAIRAAIAARHPKYALSAVLPVHTAIWAAYGADIEDPSTLHSTICSNRAYAGIRTPMRTVEGGVVPDFECRFFAEDIPYGLVVVRGIADAFGVETPTIDEVIGWSQAHMQRSYLVDGQLRGPDVEQSGAPHRYGICDGEALLARSGGHGS